MKIVKRLLKMGYTENYLASVYHSLKDLSKLSDHDLQEILQVMKMQDYYNKQKEPTSFLNKG